MIVRVLKTAERLIASLVLLSKNITRKRSFLLLIFFFSFFIAEILDFLVLFCFYMIMIREGS